MGRIDAVGHFDRSNRAWRPLETAAPDNSSTVSRSDRETECPWVHLRESLGRELTNRAIPPIDLAAILPGQSRATRLAFAELIRGEQWELKSRSRPFRPYSRPSAATRRRTRAVDFTTRPLRSAPLWFTASSPPRLRRIRVIRQLGGPC